MALEISYWDSLWHRVIRSKYGYQENGWDSNLVVRGLSRSPWKDISAGLSEFSKCSQFIVGDGKRVKFWEDIWVGDRSFSDAFPTIYRLSRLHNSSIHSLAIPNTILVSWNFGFRRNWNDEEASEVSVLLELLESVGLTVSKKDVRSWILDTSGNFSCKSI
jgi:hypothetical protein